VQEAEEDDEVFVVGGIIAKSLFKDTGPWGNEHQYLVRWAGYGPKDDTWEWSSNVAQNASGMLKQFDKEGKSLSLEITAMLTDRTSLQRHGLRHFRWP
jgi:hypothetical protein